MPNEPNPRLTEHRALLRTALLAGAMLHPYDIDAALQAIARAHPEAWRRQDSNMQLDLELLEAARPLAQLARKRMAEYTVRYEHALAQAIVIAEAVIWP